MKSSTFSLFCKSVKKAARSIPLPVLGLMAFAFVLLLSSDPAMASSTSTMPWATNLQSIEADISGPTAAIFCTLAVVGAGGMLIFGNHEFSGFIKTLFYLVLVVALIIGAHAWIETFQGSGALV